MSRTHLTCVNSRSVHSSLSVEEIHDLIPVSPLLILCRFFPVPNRRLPGATSSFNFRLLQNSPYFQKNIKFRVCWTSLTCFKIPRTRPSFLYFWGFVSSDSHAISTWQSNQCYSDNFRWNSKLIQRNVANGLDLWPDSDNQLRCHARGTDKLFMLRPSLDFHQWRNHNRKFSYFFLPPPPSMKVCDLFFLHKNRPP